MTSDDKANATATVRSGLGWFGWAMVFGMLGFGPCTDCFQGCGPRPIELYQQMQQEQCDER